MTDEFKKISSREETRYVLETASAGGTSSGSVASVAMPVGGMQRRKGDNLLTPESDQEKVKQKPRQGPLRTQTGGGKHKDKTKTIPRKDKYKRALAEVATTPSNEKVAKEINRLAQMYPGIPPEQAIYIELGKQNATNQQQGQEIRQLSRTAIGLGKDLSEKEKRFRDIDARLKSGEITQDQADEERRKVEKEYPGAERQSEPEVKKSDKTKSKKEPEKTSEPRTKNDKSVEIPRNIQNVQRVEPGETPQATPTVQPEPKIVQPEPKTDRGVGLSHMAQQLKDLPSHVNMSSTPNASGTTSNATATTTPNGEIQVDPNIGFRKLSAKNESLHEDPTIQNPYQEGDPNQGALNAEKIRSAWGSNLPSINIYFGKNKSLGISRAQMFAIMAFISDAADDNDMQERIQTTKSILSTRDHTIQWFRQPSVNNLVQAYPKWQAQELAKNQNPQQKDLLSPEEPEQQELFRDSYLFDLSSKLAEVLDTAEAYQKKTAGEKLAKRVEKHRKDAETDAEFQRRQQALRGIGDRMKPKNQDTTEAWSEKYKRSINCSHPKGFSQKAHCAGKRKHNEDFSMEMTCPNCGMCETHGDNMLEVKQRLDAHCWHNKKIGKPATKIKGGVRVNNCVPKEGVAGGYQLDEGAMETISNLVKKLPGIGKYYQIAQQYKPQLVQILKTSKSGKEVKQKMEALLSQTSTPVAEAGWMKQLGGLAVGGGSILSTMWMNAMGMIDGVLAHAAAGEVGGAVASGSILGLIPVTLMLFAAMLLFKGSKQSSDEKAQAVQAQRGQQGVAEGKLNELFNPNSSYPIETKKIDFRDTEVSATTQDGRKITCLMRYDPRLQIKIMSIDFDVNGQVQLTGQGDATKILTTVVEAVKKQVAQIDPEYLIFLADSQHQGIYSAMARRLGGDYQRMKYRDAPAIFKYYTQGIDPNAVFILHNTTIEEQGVAEGSLKEFVRSRDRREEGPGDDPYKYPKPERYRRSIDFFGQFEADHFDEEDMNDATGEFRGYWDYDGKPKQIAYFKWDNPRRAGDDDPGMGWYYEPQDDVLPEGDEYNEYSDEVDMVENNLLTIIRACKELANTLKSGENLPEWVEEKISMSKQNMVTVSEYLQSQHAQGHIYDEDHSTMSGGYGRHARSAIDVSSKLIGNGHDDRTMEAMLPASVFAGSKKNKLGPAGQWRNKGPKKNSPARAGDLVGGAAESIQRGSSENGMMNLMINAGISKDEAGYAIMLLRKKQLGKTMNTKEQADWPIYEKKLRIAMMMKRNQNIAENYLDRLQERLDQEMDERSKSQAQAQMMAAAAHNPAFAKKVGIKQNVAKEFNRADTGKDISKLPRRVVPKKRKK